MPGFPHPHTSTGPAQALQQEGRRTHQSGSGTGVLEAPAIGTSNPGLNKRETEQCVVVIARRSSFSVKVATVKAGFRTCVSRTLTSNRTSGRVSFFGIPKWAGFTELQDERGGMDTVLPRSQCSKSKVLTGFTDDSELQV